MHAIRSIRARIRSDFARAFDRDVLGRPRLTLFLVALIVGISLWYAQDFALDASSDSLLLENDRDLRYYRGIRARYGSDDYLVVTYTTKPDLFAPATLAEIKQLRDELAALEADKEHQCHQHTSQGNRMPPVKHTLQPGLPLLALQ